MVEELDMRTAAFLSRLETLNYIISSYYSTATVFALGALVLTALTGAYMAMLLFVVAAWMVILAEINVERMHAMTLEYLRACGIDISDAPKPLFHSFRQWFPIA